MNLSVLREMLEIEEQISELVILSSPRNDAEAALVRQLARSRDRLHGGIRRLLELGVQDATVDLTKSTQALEDLSDEIERVTKSIEGVKTAMEITSKVLDVAAGIAKLLVAA
jgi:hypothetical protein